MGKMETMRKIKQRRKINREIRNKQNEDEKRKLREDYYKIKQEIQEELREAIKQEEIEIAEELIANKNKKIWEVIQKIRGTRKSMEDTTIIDEQGNELELEEGNRQMTDFWNRLAKSSRGEKDLESMVRGKSWKEEPTILEEHNYSQRNETWNEDPRISEEETRNALKILRKIKRQDQIR